MNFEHKDIEDIIERAIVRAFERMGIDTEDAPGTRADFAYLRRRRKLGESASGRLLTVIIGVTATAALYAMWEGITAKFISH